MNRLQLLFIGTSFTINIWTPYFEEKEMVAQIYPSELQLNKANSTDTEALFLDLHLSISNGFVSFKIYNERDDFKFDIVLISLF